MGKKNKESLGRALIKDRFSRNRNKRHVEDTMLHTTEINDGYDWGRLNLQSVTAESSLQEFLSTAELAQKEFTAEKMNFKYIKFIPTEVEAVTSQPDFDEPLTVPRRPKWHPGITAEEQMTRERESFLAWRRHLNELQDKLGAAVTPYERNIELWKQLWRTLEKSDVVLILLDARNPLLFRCEDLEKYASEQNCKCILLLNKADLTSEYHRKCWVKYFDDKHISIIFFSAAKTSIENAISEEDEIRKTDDEDSTDSEADAAEVESIEAGQNDRESLDSTKDDIELFKRQINDLDVAVSNTSDKLNEIQTKLDDLMKMFKNRSFRGPVYELEMKEPLNSHEIFDRAKLIDRLTQVKLDLELRLKNQPRVTVGLIGYPNVGKSSTVNTLMQTKKVSVSAMPGHTRYIQSLILNQDIELLDCPGLVLPAYAVTPDLLLTAVLPIDQMRAHDAAVARLCQLVGRRTFADKYGLLLPDSGRDSHADYKQILTAHAYNRGFMTARGQPDVARSARLLLKDAASGRLKWEQLPPRTTPPANTLPPDGPFPDSISTPSLDAPSPDEISSSSQTDRKLMKPERKPTPLEARMVEGWRNRTAEIDRQFFAANQSTAHVKGKPIVGLTGDQLLAQHPLVGKPWKLEKKHANKNKKEKLRRVYRHLDEH